MMIWGGLLLGLLAFQATRLWPPPEIAVEAPAPPVARPDPYAEAERSRAILRAQERSPQRAEPVGRGQADTVRVSVSVRVIDGDTFDYGGTRVRVADIDTPEVHGRCAYESELAARATVRMRTLLAAGPFELHWLASGRDEDSYGRKLRIVTRGGRSLGDVLVGEGLARTWTGRREPWC